MNSQRKLIKRVCAVGMTGVLAAGLATAKPIAALTLDHVIAAEGEEEKRWEDMTEEERMALPEEERERLKAEAEKRYDFQQIHIIKTGGLSTLYANEGGIIISY